ncbi:hypothetical protein MBUL_02722 [Methylobacterium bullatum]|uniref:PilZ domain-containing protein n=1 Tax=Methylobacterium bullatum TaxID=570505 RepID=A0A679JDJ2_9HYPH|nr:hypothetical protein MBUL_02722 [Methylobacterium bullatum]
MRSDKEAETSSEPVLRREDRNPSNWIANVRLPDGREIPCTVKDVSKSGAKLGIPAYHELPDSFLLRIIGRDFVCMVKVAWRRGDYVGVRIERVGKVAPPRVQVAAPQPVATSLEQPQAIDESGGVGIPSRRRKPAPF